MACDPNELLEDAKCYLSCFRGDMYETAMILLLCKIRDSETIECDPEAITADPNFACIKNCIPPGARGAVIISLLCDIAAAGGGGGGGGVPYEVTGATEAEFYSEALVDRYTDVPGLTALELTVDAIGDFNFAELSDLVSFSAPSLVSFSSGTFYFDNLPELVSLSVPLLQSGDNDIDLYLNSLVSLTTVNLDALQAVAFFSLIGATSITSLSLPALTTAEITITGCTLLTTLSLPLWTPSNASNVTMVDNALSADSVNHVLARCIANPAYAVGTVSLDGGTNAAPTGQGIFDKATLQGRGLTVVTN